jgi:hypothetical protein
MQSKRMRCPKCGTTILPTEIRYPSFNCRHCHCEVCVPKSYSLKIRLSTLPLTFVLCYLVGLRGLAFFLVFCLATPIAGMFVIAAFFRLFPPTIDAYFPSGSIGTTNPESCDDLTN